MNHINPKTNHFDHIYIYIAFYVFPYVNIHAYVERLHACIEPNMVCKQNMYK